MTDEIQKPKNHRKKKVILLSILLALLLAAVAIWLIWLFFFSFLVSTDDAYVGGNIVQLSSRQRGTVTAFYTDDTFLVQEGQLLVQLDPTDYHIAYEKQRSALAQAARRVQEIWDQVDNKKASLDLAQAKLILAEKEYQDRSNLIESSAISQEEFEQYKTTSETAKASYEIALAEFEVAKTERGNTPKEQHPFIIESKLNLIDAFIALQRCNIYSPATGYVAKRTVQVGQTIAAGTPLLSVVPLNEIWVDANYKETQLENIRIGQPADVIVDIYGGKVAFQGKVVGIYPGSGSVFSLLPAQNATGNWINIVQRLPVRIGFENCNQLQQYPLMLGLSCEVKVNITDLEGNALALKPSLRRISSTNIYDLSFISVENEIKKILKENLR